MQAFTIHAAGTDPIDAAIEAIPGVQRVEDHNLPMLADILTRYDWEDSYAGSATYFALTGRHGLWIAARDSSFMLIARHPADPDKLMVFPPAGEGWKRILGPVLSQLPATSGGFQLARFPAATADKAASLTSWAVPGAQLTTRNEDALDWRYPVHVLDTAAVAAHKGRAFKDFRNNVNRVDEARLQILDLDPQRHRNALTSIAAAWAEQRGEGTHTVPAGLTEPYERLLNLTAHLPGQGRLYVYHDKPAGFITWEETDPARGVANSFASLTTREHKGLSEFMFADMCARLAARGFQEVGIGGSEDASLDAFKRKMQPVRSVPLASLHYRRSHIPAQTIGRKAASLRK